MREASGRNKHNGICKRSRQREATGNADALHNSLCAIGEAFMCSFDDYEEDSAKLNEGPAHPACMLAAQRSVSDAEAPAWERDDGSLSCSTTSTSEESPEQTAVGSQDTTVVEIVFQSRLKGSSSAAHDRYRGPPGFSGRGNSGSTGSARIKNPGSKDSAVAALDFDLEKARREVADFGAIPFRGLHESAEALVRLPLQVQKIHGGTGQQSSSQASNSGRMRSERLGPALQSRGKSIFRELDV